MPSDCTAPTDAPRASGGRGNVARGAAIRLSLLCAAASLAACSSGPASRYSRYYARNGAYRAPGPAEDPWRPYILDASSRFSVPQEWIRAVIQQESGGHEYLDGEPITSSAGAMGLMQLMPQTYADMQQQNALGPDPYEPHDNILAGTAYLRQMYDRYGAPGFLAAYNAGPQRLDDYLQTGRALPNETVNYLASVTPNLGNAVALSGPLAAYGGATQMVSASPTALPIVMASATRPASPALPVVVTPTIANPTGGQPVQYAAYVPRARIGRAARCAQNPDSAYDPDAPCPPASGPAGTLPPPSPTVPEVLAPPIASAPRIVPAVIRMPAAPHVLPSDGVNYGQWAVQVGAFTSEGQARFANTMARQAAFTALNGARSVVQPVPLAGRALYRARLSGLAQGSAASACSTLRQQGLACMVIRPGQ
ncbi:lytic transglycosylase domain-containing protein [Gluconacetobacter tumulisoli]|uniref:Transglycosylase SLT domain-containing protein n=1 Tax=Gluconacetobacter tumulisoli TaxID=1286189 RepID=A0A7W4PNZ5_9PROT|nr:lytic transglycosylase domain-containing protein [Gluconacetobacter tumulisoli]MBB2203079.1 transglycosylase SLT domain-containing protein [Gluconacetobacter tumulisoli]